MKKISLFLILSTLIFASNNEIKEKFDGSSGWWFYEEEVKNPKTEEIDIISYKLSPAEKLKIDQQKKTNKLLKLLLEEQTKTRKLNEIIANRLIYAYPDVTPKYTINKKTGEKCLTNSSKDCFVMPVIAEAQHFPALEKFLRDPSPENSKNWLQVQATYFNHVNKVSNGLRFAYLKDGAEAYPINTDYTYGDSLVKPQALNSRMKREEEIRILKLRLELSKLSRTEIANKIIDDNIKPVYFYYHEIETIINDKSVDKKLLEKILTKFKTKEKKNIKDLKNKLIEEITNRQQCI
jgi:hypothetical protein